MSLSTLVAPPSDQDGPRTSTVIRARGLTKQFGERTAVDALDLSVAAGEVLAVLGPNGAGKTTTVRLLNGVLRPDHGEAEVLGIDPWRDGDELRRRTGVLTENAGLDDRLTARENLLYSAAMRGLRGQQGERCVDERLEEFAMAELADVPTHGFSTGQRKRLALARALLHEPDVLFLDEPTSGLDPAATREVLDLIERLSADHGRTVLLCTHFLAEAGRVADRMAVIHAGHLHALGRPEEIARELWSGLDIEIDLGRPADAAFCDRVDTVPGVIGSRPSDSGADVVVRDRDVLPALHRALGRGPTPVYAVIPHPPTLEDVYFAVHERVIGAAPVEPEPQSVPA